MRNWDDYQELYNAEDNWYLEYVDSKLKQIKRRYKNENNSRTKTRK